MKGMALFKGWNYVGDIDETDARFLALLPYGEYTDEYYVVEGMDYANNPVDVLSIRIRLRKNRIKISLDD